MPGDSFFSGESMPDILYDTIIIGGGVAALGAAIYCGRFEMKTLLIGEKLGGNIINTNEIANYPGFEMISGVELVEKLQKQAESYNAEITSGKVQKVKKNAKCFSVLTSDAEFRAKTVIFATGTDWRKLSVPGEKEFSGKGVHYCALCDGAFYKDKIVAVVGGSDSAAKDALLLTQYAKKVYIIYRKEDIRAEAITCSRVGECRNIEILPDTNVLEIKGDKFVNKIILDKPYKGSKEFRVDGLFIDIGHIPMSDLAKETGLKLNEKSEVIIDRYGNTNISGIFAAGDVTDNAFKQVITGVAQGSVAAYNAYHYIKKTPIDSCDSF